MPTTPISTARSRFRVSIFGPLLALAATLVAAGPALACTPNWGGLYSGLVTRIHKPNDLSQYGKCRNYGRWSGTSWGGVRVPANSYWVYVYPNWYVWRAKAGTNRPPGNNRPTNPGTTGSGVLGRVWHEREVAGWRGVWTRVGRSNVFRARWRHPSGDWRTGRLKIVIHGRNVRVDRWTDRNRGGEYCLYRGVLSPDRRTVRGRYRCQKSTGGWYPVYGWAARIVR